MYTMAGSYSTSLLVGCYLSLVLSTTSEWTVYVNKDGGRNEPNCLLLPGANRAVHPNLTACRSLDFVASKLGNGSSGLAIVIETDLMLSGVVRFHNCSSLTITSGNVERGVVLSTTNTTCGLLFYGVTNLTLSGITVTQCQHRPGEDVINMNRDVAVHMHQVTDLTVRFISVLQISGTALVISDASGLVVIESSTFTNNTISDDSITNNNVFAGGIHMQFNRSVVQKTEMVNIMVKDCTFENNIQPKNISIDPVHYHHHDLQTLHGYGTGGGMGILFMGHTQGVSVSVENCTFANNKANLGAGLYVHFQDDTTDNSFTVANTVFVNNSGNAGGGMSVGIGRLRYVKGEIETFNQVTVTNTTFTGNKARYGGGTSLVAIHSTDFSPNRTEMVYFFNCTWVKNEAYYSLKLLVPSKCTS